MAWFSSKLRQGCPLKTEIALIRIVQELWASHCLLVRCEVCWFNAQLLARHLPYFKTHSYSPWCPKNPLASIAWKMDSLKDGQTHSQLRYRVISYMGSINDDDTEFTVRATARSSTSTSRHLTSTIRLLSPRNTSNTQSWYGQARRKSTACGTPTSMNGSLGHSSRYSRTWHQSKVELEKRHCTIIFFRNSLCVGSRQLTTS